MPSIKDVARAAGVSPGTVSNTLHNPERVNRETRQRVEEAIVRLGYRPDPSAQGIRQRRSGIIGAMLPQDYAEVIMPLMLGAINEAALNRQTLLVSPPYLDPESEKAALHNLLNKPIDALLYMPRNIDVPLPEFRLLQTIPIVGLIRRTMEVPSIYIDSHRSAYLATRYLLSLGRRKIAFLCGIGSYGRLDSARVLIELAHSDRAGVHIAADRLLGYEQALREEGLSLDPDLIFFSDFRIEGGQRAARQILSRSGIDGVLADSDPSAYGLIRFLQHQGFRVPEDISVIGYGDDSICELCTPGITTVTRNSQALGQEAVRLANRLLAGESEADSVAIPSELVLRESTKMKS